MRIALLAALLFLLLAATALSQRIEAKCPEIKIVGPEGITNPGEATFIRVDVAGLDSRLVITYEWTVSTGQKITRGQGTNKIRVQSRPQDGGSAIVVAVTIKGLPEKCINSASGFVDMADPLTGDVAFDAFGRLPWSKEKAHLDDFLTQLHFYSTSTVFIVIQIENDETIDNTKKHAIEMVEYIKSRAEDFDLGRLRFAIHKGSDRHLTSFHIYLEGANLPECTEGCTMLNGKHISR
ncbi:MAG: hypothetical protein ABJB40_12150 [Acidobacteriota bacterium]